MLYRARMEYDGELSYVFDEGAAEEIEDFQESVAECIDDMMDALDRLKELICSFPVPDEEPYPFNPKPTAELTPTDGKELPF